jgi:hypothetical protein
MGLVLFSQAPIFMAGLLLTLTLAIIALIGALCGYLVSTLLFGR